MFEEQANLVARLALHQSQRYQSIPTLSVLMGKTIETRHGWNQWLEQVQRQTAVTVFTTKPALFETWLTVVAAHHDLRSLVLQRIARLVDQPVEQLAAWFAQTSDYQMQLFWHRLAPASDEMVILRSLLDIVPAAQEPIRNTDNPSTACLQDGDVSAILNHFVAVAELLPPSSLPGLFVLLPEESAYTELRAALTTLTVLVETVPAIPVALALTGTQAQLALTAFPESRVKAMLRSGLIDVVSPQQNALRQWLCSRGVNDETRLQSILNLVERYGMTTDLLEAALPLTDPAGLPDSVEADTLYRSQAERFLYQYLETNPKTVGRFQVNAPLDIDFGGHKMEVDFLDAATKIVIELDGYYHFESRNAYRRDRHKDRTLQLHGYLVLRFLAEDVVREFETIFATIDQALAVRQPLTTNPLEA